MSGFAGMMLSNFAAPVVAAAVESDTNTKVLFHMEGANGSTTITNSVTGGLSFTKGSYAGTSITTADFKFGSASYRSTQTSSAGASNSGIYPTTKTLANGSWVPRDYWWANDTTCESWVYLRSNTSGGQFIIWHGLGTPRFNAGFWNTASGASMSFDVEMSLGGPNSTYTAGSNGVGYYYLKWTIGNSILNTWAHIALVRTGSALKLFINGTDQGAATVTTGSGRTSATIFSTTSPYVGATGTGVTANLAIGDIGGPYTDYGFRNSNMDDFRFSNGIARYTTTFSVPTAAFPDA